MTPAPIARGRARQFAGVLADLANSEGSEQRWLRTNSAAIRRAHAEMLAERSTTQETRA